MIAYVGVPGSCHHTWQHFPGRSSKPAAEEWARCVAQRIREDNPALGSLPYGTLSDKDAGRVKWRDGSRVYSFGTPGALDYDPGNWDEVTV